MDANYDDSGNVYTVIVDGFFRGCFNSYSGAWERAVEFLTGLPGNPNMADATNMERLDFADGFSVSRKVGNRRIQVISSPVRS